MPKNYVGSLEVEREDRQLRPPITVAEENEINARCYWLKPLFRSVSFKQGLFFIFFILFDWYQFIMVFFSFLMPY